MQPWCVPMTTSKIALLKDRGLVSVSGPDAEKMLQALITNEMALLAHQPALYAGLLSPQGKILFDFIVMRMADGFVLDVAGNKAADLTKRLEMYKLRANARVKDASAERVVFAMWGGQPGSIVSPQVNASVTDPRLSELGTRFVSERQWAGNDAAASKGEITTEGAYHAHRIKLGVPEGGKDFMFGDAFPHEALFDQLGGVSFTKGCYVGQEIVARMEHRGTARTRIVPVIAETVLPPPGADIIAGDVTIGTLGSTAGTRGLAMLRLDRAEEMRRKGQGLRAATVPVRIELPAWVRFPVGGPAAAANP